LFVLNVVSGVQSLVAQAVAGRVILDAVLEQLGRHLVVAIGFFLADIAHEAAAAQGALF
jgi:hypothetical protein